MIEASNLSKHFDTVRALHRVSFSVGRGEVVGLLGPNGAGKSTAMRLLVGYLTPTEGTARLAGFDVQKHPLEVRRRLGYLPELNPLYEEMEVTEYLEYIGRMRQLKTPHLLRRIKEVIGLCGLSQAIGKDVAELSKGYRQRLGFASAILHDPDILILDEPTSGLDPNQVREMRQLISELKREKTLILSTHILSEVQATCDRVIIINNGQIVADGKTQEISSGQNALYVELKGPREKVESSLNELVGVRQVREEESRGVWHYWRLEIDAGTDPREEVFELALKKKWGLRELHLERASLEEVFAQLTSEEEKSS